MNIARFIAPICLLVAGCDRDAKRAQDAPPLQGAAIGGPFTLTDQNGLQVTDRSFAGRYRIMYFGYTSCPDVCPTDAQSIGGGLNKLEASEPAMAVRIVPVFVTLDPKRDTPAVLGQFVRAFHPRMVGLTGTDAQLAAAAKGYAIWFERLKPNEEGNYLVNHSRQTYLMDPNGKPLALLPSDKGAEAVAEELRRWVT